MTPHPIDARPDETTRSRTLDRVVSWVLVVVQVLASLVLGLFSLSAIVMIGTCGATETEAAVCDGGYFGGVLIGFWVVLLALAVASVTAVVVAIVRRRASWPWPLGGIVLVALSSVLFVALMTR